MLALCDFVVLYYVLLIYLAFVVVFFFNLSIYKEDRHVALTLRGGGINVASEAGRSKAQVVLRWAVQNGMGVLPRSSKEQRLLENAQLFDFSLTSDQMRRISALDRQQFSYWDPHGTPAMHAFKKSGTVICVYLDINVLVRHF